MAMTRKNYEAVARAINTERENWRETPEVQSALSYLVSNLSGVFAADNQAFDRERFAKAAGGGLS